MEIKSKEIKIVPISELKPNPQNRNKHPQEQIDRLAEIIKYQGFRSPIVVSNQSGFIVMGHGRLEAAKIAGLKEVPVIYQDFDSAEQEYAAQVSDNAVALWAELDLSSINNDLAELGPDFDIDLLGIKNFTLDVAEKEALTDEDEIPEAKETRVKRGDIWKLGNHRLMCGDSTMIDDVEKLMNGEKADLVFTDPPYNTGMKAKPGSTRLNHFFEDSYTDDEWNNLLKMMASNYWSICKENVAAYVCLDWRRSHELVPVFKNSGFKFSNLIVWDKMVHGLGSDYKYTHEFIHLFKKGKPELDTNHGAEDYRDIWHIQRKIGKDDEHATKKPIELVERAIRHNPKCLNIVDLFCGSGTTLIAAEKMNKSCYAMELSESYCDVILTRWESYTGQKAELING